MLWKNLLRMKKNRVDLSKGLLQQLAKTHKCYILITCGEPSPEGEMQVEMSYEGDQYLAMFLLENAYAHFQKQLNS